MMRKIWTCFNELHDFLPRCACCKSWGYCVCVFRVDLSSRPWPCWDIVHVWLRVSSWLLWDAGQLSMHGKSKSVVVIPLWLISESFAHPWLHCGGGNGTKTLFVSVQKCASFSSGCASKGRYRATSPWHVFKHLKCCDFTLAWLEGAFQSLLYAADFFPNTKAGFFFFCCVRLIFPLTRLPLPDWLSVRCYHLYNIAEHFLSSEAKFECIFFL